MNKYKISKTYFIIIPDSKEAENGEFSETGFIYEDKEFDSLEEIARELNDYGVYHDGDGSFCTKDCEIDMYTFEHTIYDFHLKKIGKNDLKKLLKLIE